MSNQIKFYENPGLSGRKWARRRGRPERRHGPPESVVPDVTAAPDDAAPGGPADPSGRGRADFPVVLDLAGRPCLVVGGGPVAARKARALVAAGARVTVVAVDVDPAVDAIEELAAVGRDAPTGSGSRPASTWW